MVRGNRNKLNDMTYNVISPDGFPIERETTYTTIYKAYRALVRFKQRYARQGYYSSVNYGKIHPLDIKDYCEIVATKVS